MTQPKWLLISAVFVGTGYSQRVFRLVPPCRRGINLPLYGTDGWILSGDTLRASRNADAEHTPEVARLLKQLAEALARRATLETQLGELDTWVTPIRREFGNPFFYSGPVHARPENAEKSAARYTGQASHEVVVHLLNPIVLQLHDVTREVIEIRQQLRELGHEAQ